MRTKLLMPHSDECHALAAVARGDWKTPWWMPGEVEYRDAIGREGNGGTRRWMVLRCNASNCSARMIVSHEDLLTAIAAAQEGTR